MPLPVESWESAVRITTFGDLRGTGFLIRVRSDGGNVYSYIITAHHNIRNQIGIEVEVPNPFTNGKLYPPKEVINWKQPLANADLAVARYEDDADRNHHATWLEALWPGVPDLGQQIYYVGIFAPLDRPMARSGTIGAVEQHGLGHSHGIYDFPAHLVDCRSYDGFSGSPCSMEVAFAREYGKDIPEWVPDKDVAGLNYYTLLCGMFTSHFSDEDDPDAEGTVSRYGVGVMLLARLIVEALMADELRRERMEWDQQRATEERRKQPPLQDARAD